jgi:predicted outer membrane protein
VNVIMRLLSICLLTVPSVLVLSQEPATPRQRPAQDSASVSKTRATQADGILAGWLAVDSQNEVALAQIAQQKAQDPEVKQFAQKMIDDHRRMAEQLQPFAASAGFATSVASSGSTPADRAPEGRVREAGFSGGELDHAALIQELGKQCLDTARRELEQKSGAEFDRCFVGMMIGDHMKANDMLTVFQRHASSDLASVFSEGQTTVKMHLDHAKEIAHRLEGGAEARLDDTRKMGDDKK